MKKQSKPQVLTPEQLKQAALQEWVARHGDQLRIIKPVRA